MEPPKSLEFLIRRCSRGRITFQIIWVSAIFCAASFLFFAELRPWSVAAFIIAVVSTLGLKHVSARQALAFRLLHQPDLIYWVQPRAAASNLEKEVTVGKEILGAAEHLVGSSWVVLYN